MEASNRSLMAVGFREDSSGNDWVSDLGNGDIIVVCEPDLCCGYKHSWRFTMIKEHGTVGFGVLEADLGCH